MAGGIKPNQMAPLPLVEDEQGSDPVPGANRGAFFEKDVGGVTEGHHVDSAGVVTQITSLGSVVGEANTASNVNTAGGAEGLFKQKVGADLEFKSIVAGPNVTVTPVGDDLVIAATDTGEDNTGSNEGTGEGVFIGKTGANLRFKSILAGSNMTVTPVGQDIVLDASVSTPGEANTVSNQGAGNGIFIQKTGVDLELKTLVAGVNITITPTADTLEIASAAGAGEANTGLNIGSGTGEVFKQKSGTVFEFRRILAGAGMTVTNNANEIEIAAAGGAGETNTASNVNTAGGTVGVFKQKSVADLEFHSLLAGTNMTVTLVGDDIVLASTGGSGETNTASNVGTGAGQVFKQKAVADLELKTIKAGANITVTNNADDIEIAASAGGVEEFLFQLPAAATINARIAGVTNLPAGWALDTADAAAEAEFGSDIDTLIITWNAGVQGAKLAAEMIVFQETTGGPAVTQGFIKLDLTTAGDQKTKTDKTKAAVFLAGKGVSATKNIEVFVKLI